MKKYIDKLCLHGDNIITLIKHFIKHKIKQYKKGGNNYVTAGNESIISMEELLPLDRLQSILCDDREWIMRIKEYPSEVSG